MRSNHCKSMSSKPRAYCVTAVRQRMVAEPVLSRLQRCKSFKIYHKETGSIGAFHANAPRELERAIGGGGSLDAHSASRSAVVTPLLDVRQTVGRRPG
jgi:hypothetical protein